MCSSVNNWEFNINHEHTHPRFTVDIYYLHLEISYEYLCAYATLRRSMLHRVVVLL